MTGDLPGWVCLVPPAVAIALSLSTRQVLPSLFLGVVAGATLLAPGLDPVAGLARSLDRYVVGALADADHMAIVIFSLALGGLVGIMTRSGGTQGLVELLARLARGPRSAQLATWLLGLVVFFDDYANALLVGNAMRPLTDRLRVSREKLAFIVDSTSAPVASLALISTWIGFEVSLLQTALDSAGRGSTGTGWQLFVATLPYRFYPLLLLYLVGLIAASGRDLGPMLKAERRAWLEGLPSRPGAAPLASRELTELAPVAGRRPLVALAVLPLLAVIAVTLWAQIGKGADPYRSLLWGAFAGCGLAAVLALATRRLSPGEITDAWLVGLRAMLLAVLVLTLAWALGGVCKDLGLSEWVISQSQRWTHLAHFLPALSFAVAALISFATGSSWTTMSVMVPVIVPLSLPLEAGSPAQLGAVGGVLAGAIFGDHCSPLSDTTVLSSMGSACDHVDHVRTQLPYALLCAAAALLLGCLPAGWGWGAGWGLGLGLAAVSATLWVVGRRVDRP